MTWKEQRKNGLTKKDSEYSFVEAIQIVLQIFFMSWEMKEILKMASFDLF